MITGCQSSCGGHGGNTRVEKQINLQRQNEKKGSL